MCIVVDQESSQESSAVNAERKPEKGTNVNEFRISVTASRK